MHVHRRIVNFFVCLSYNRMPRIIRGPTAIIVSPIMASASSAKINSADIVGYC